MKNIQKNTKKLIKLAGFGLVSLTLLASCGEDKEAYNAWQDKYPYVTCSYDDFNKTKPRGNTCFENKVETISNIYKEFLEKNMNRDGFYKNEKYLKFAIKNIKPLIYKKLLIEEAKIERKKINDLDIEFYKKKNQGVLDKELGHTIYEIEKKAFENFEEYPKLFKIQEQIYSFSSYSKPVEEDMFFPDYLSKYSYKHLETCKDAEDIFVCLDKLK